MNRADFQQLAELRLQEAKALLAANSPDGAYYLAGYVVECALKACIAKRTREFDFPDRRAKEYYNHDLARLFDFADLRLEFESELQAIPAMRANWAIVQNWSEESRYQQGRSTQEALDLLNAIEDRTGGLLPWLQKRW